MKKNKTEIELASDLLADIVGTLMMSGSNTPRLIRNARRFADAIGYSVDFFISLSAFTLSLRNKETDEVYTLVRSIPHIGVNFEMLTKISVLSWELKPGDCTLEQVREKFQALKNSSKRYSEYLLCALVGVAGAALSRIMGGSFLEFFVSFLATVGGLCVRNLLLKKGYKPFIVFFVASFTAVSVVNLFRLFTPDSGHISYSLAACVLFLIPGVPLINSLIDILEGYVSVGVFRGVFGLKIVFAIALGFFASLTLFSYYGFA